MRYKFLSIILLVVMPLFSLSQPSSSDSTLSVYKKPFLIKKLEFQEINSWYYLYLRQCLEQIKSKEADVVILELDSPGGRIDIALKIVNRLLSLKSDLFVYINENAISAGALISLTGKKIYINEGGVIGASTPVYIKEGEMKKAPEKSVSVMRSKFRSLAEKYNRPVRICEAMVDDEIELTQKTDGIDLAKGKLLTLTQKESLKLGITDKGVFSLEEVLADLGLKRENLMTYEITGGLKLLNFFSNPMFLSLLMMIGSLGLIFEAKTPGWGLGGTIGVLALASFFIIQILVNNTDWKIPALFGVGIILILLEVFIIPGFGLPGIAGVISILSAFILSFGINNWQTAVASVTLAIIGVIVGTILIIRYVPESNMFKKIALGESLKDNSSGMEVELKLGDKGLTIVDLKPYGKVKFPTGIFEVTSQNDFIEKNRQVEIVQVKQNKITVVAI